MKKIAFIGVGRMGRPIVKNLMKLGFELHVYSQSLVKVYDVVGEGAKYHSAINDCVKECDVVITMVGFPKDVEEVYFYRGLLDSAKEKAYLIDMTTTSPTLAQKLYTESKKRGFYFLDAPVSGNENAAKKGKLLILVGGDFDDYKSFMPSNINEDWIWNDSELNTLLSKANLELGTLNGYASQISKPNNDSRNNSRNFRSPCLRKDERFRHSEICKSFDIE